jgi:hypothetical protein
MKIVSTCTKAQCLYPQQYLWAKFLPISLHCSVDRRLTYLPTAVNKLRRVERGGAQFAYQVGGEGGRPC